MNAHVDQNSRRTQSLYEHSKNVAELCRIAAKEDLFGSLGELCGWLHDMGKATTLYQQYLNISAGPENVHIRRGEVHHAPVGAIYAYRRWYQADAQAVTRMTAELIMLTVYGHHSGLMDVIAPDGKPYLLDRMLQDTDMLHYEEAVSNYEMEVLPSDKLDLLFFDAVKEVGIFLDCLKKTENTDKPIMRAMLTRELLAILVDADRWDSACFAYETDPFEKSAEPGWSDALDKLKDYLGKIDRGGRIDSIRAHISDDCEQAANGSGKLYRLSVPTGGGKTFASLRFALRYALSHASDIKRIFYIIPFNTILDQNAKDIRDALGNTLRILEHHSNVVFEGENADEEYENHRLLTERWDSDLILTSMVQFLNSFFRAENTDARRLPHLSDSILIFDEIQALPKKCTRLFECAIDFLTEFCGCTVVLCTATQPALQFHLSPIDIISDIPVLFRNLKRTRLIDDSKTALSYPDAAERATELIRRYGAVLMIVNTKEAAREIAALMKERVETTVHLSTDMVPAHRLKIIERIKNRNLNQPLFCVSTNLIEAGINISFPCVVRSLAGLDNILQAAGRCNRNSELGEGMLGDVYIWNLREEKLGNLLEIEMAQQVTRGILTSDFTPDSPEGIELYYRNERDAFAKQTYYPITDPNTTLIELFGRNATSTKELPADATVVSFPIPGAFHTVGERFRVIDQQTRSVLVPYQKGEELITKLCASRDMKEKTILLMEAQRYSLSLYENKFRDFIHDGKILYDVNSGVFILKKEYYSSDTGVTDTPAVTDYLEL